MYSSKVSKESEYTREKYEAIEKKLNNIMNVNFRNSSYSSQIINNHMYDVDIIVPCFNVEKSVVKCINSILHSVKFAKINCRIIIINDGSKDSTRKKLQRFESASNVIIIDQKNKGLSGARNSGLDLINSKYLMFVDSDDTISKKAIKKMFEKITSGNCDIVVGDYSRRFLFLKKKVHICEDINEIPGFAWGKMYKSDLRNNVRFYLGYWFEDTIIKTIIFNKSKKIGFTKSNDYCYTINFKGISKRSRGNPKSIDSILVYYLCLCDMNRLNVNINSLYNYNYFLMHIVLTFKRLMNCAYDIKKEAFLIIMYLYKKYFQNLNTNITDLYNVESYLRLESYDLIEYCINL